MSELSGLSHDYTASALFADEFNALLLRLKKAIVNAPGMEAYSEPALAEVRDKLAGVLEQLVIALDPSKSQETTEVEELSHVPDDIVERVRKKHLRTYAYFLEDLTTAIQVLRSGGTVPEQSIKVLDDLCDVADSIASAAFRRLWRH